MRCRQGKNVGPGGLPHEYGPHHKEIINGLFMWAMN